MVLITFGEEVTKILRNLCLNFARQDGRDRKKWKENHAIKITKIPKTKIWDEQNMSGNGVVKIVKRWPKTKTQKYGKNKTKIFVFAK